jgi:hypothetical protein
MEEDGDYRDGGTSGALGQDCDCQGQSLSQRSLAPWGSSLTQPG